VPGIIISVATAARLAPWLMLQRVVDDALDDGSRQGQRGAHQHGQNGTRHPVLPDVEIVGQ